MMWVWFSVSQKVADNFWLAILLATALFSTTCFSLYRLTCSGKMLDAFSKIICIVTLVLLMFLAWILLMSKLPMHYPVFPRTFPKILILSTFFVPGLVAAIIVASLFAYPLMVLFPRHYWLVTSITTAIFVPLQFNALFSSSSMSMSRGIMFYDLACLLVFVPILINLIFSRVQRHWNAAG